MQCFTYGHKYPRTTLRHDYLPPHPEQYKKRQPFKPEPTKIGRPWCPDGIVDPERKRVLYEPVYATHRDNAMDEMLEFINRTNWTGGQDMKWLGRRKSKFPESLKHSLQTVHRSSYQWPQVGKEQRINPDVYPTVGATPTTYTVIPYVAPKDHPYVITQYEPVLPHPPDPHSRCGRFTVPHYNPAPYPGPPLPESAKKMDQKNVTNQKPALVP